jgi:hypothetical protein
MRDYQRRPRRTGIAASLRGPGAGAALAAAAVLGGCNMPATLQNGANDLETYGGQMVGFARPFAIVDTVSLINTDKTIIDHLAGVVSGQDCSTLRSMDGGHYCQPRYENVPVVPPLYCYRTLGAVTCYDQPSPNTGDKLVGIRPGGQLPTY